MTLLQRSIVQPVCAKMLFAAGDKPIVPSSLTRSRMCVRAFNEQAAPAAGVHKPAHQLQANEATSRSSLQEQLMLAEQKVDIERSRAEKAEQALLEVRNAINKLTDSLRKHNAAKSKLGTATATTNSDADAAQAASAGVTGVFDSRVAEAMAISLEFLCTDREVADALLYMPPAGAIGSSSGASSGGGGGSSSGSFSQAGADVNDDIVGEAAAQAYDQLRAHLEQAKEAYAMAYRRKEQAHEQYIKTVQDDTGPGPSSNLAKATEELQQAEASLELGTKFLQEAYDNFWAFLQHDPVMQAHQELQEIVQQVQEKRQQLVQAAHDHAISPPRPWGASAT